MGLMGSGRTKEDCGLGRQNAAWGSQLRSGYSQAPAALGTPLISREIVLQSAQAAAFLADMFEDETQ